MLLTHAKTIVSYRVPNAEFLSEYESNRVANYISILSEHHKQQQSEIFSNQEKNIYHNVKEHLTSSTFTARWGHIFSGVFPTVTARWDHIFSRAFRLRWGPIVSRAFLFYLLLLFVLYIFLRIPI